MILLSSIFGGHRHKDGVLEAIVGWLHYKSSSSTSTLLCTTVTSHVLSGPYTELAKGPFKQGHCSASQSLRSPTPRVSASETGSLAIGQPSWRAVSTRMNAYTINSQQSLFHGHIKHVVWESANFKSLCIVEWKCLVQGVTGIRFLSDPLELLYFLSVAFKRCLGIKCANMRHELLLWNKMGMGIAITLCSEQKKSRHSNSRHLRMEVRRNEN